MYKNAVSKRGLRKCRGAGIVEGIVGLAVVIIGSTLAVLLLLNAGGAAYNKEKISLVADQAACYATSLPNDSTRQGLVATMVNDLLSSMGIGTGNATVDVQDVTIGTQACVQVTVTTSVSTLLTGRFTSVMPAQITMSDTSAVPKNAWYMGYIVGLLPTGQMITLPLTNPVGTVPNDSLPAWNISLLGEWKIR